MLGYALILRSDRQPICRSGSALWPERSTLNKPRLASVLGQRTGKSKARLLTIIVAVNMIHDLSPQICVVNAGNSEENDEEYYVLPPCTAVSVRLIAYYNTILCTTSMYYSAGSFNCVLQHNIMYYLYCSVGAL